MSDIETIKLNRCKALARLFGYDYIFIARFRTEFEAKIAAKRMLKIGAVSEIEIRPTIIMKADGEEIYDETCYEMILDGRNITGINERATSRAVEKQIETYREEYRNIICSEQILKWYVRHI